jgi:hypothetical protein
MKVSIRIGLRIGSLGILGMCICNRHGSRAAQNLKRLYEPGWGTKKPAGPGAIRYRSKNAIRSDPDSLFAYYGNVNVDFIFSFCISGTWYRTNFRWTDYQCNLARGGRCPYAQVRYVVLEDVVG